MVHFTSTPLFQIRLPDNTLTMRGSQTESVGCVLRGQLVLVITEPTKFNEIKLTFQGKSKVRWVDNTGSYKEERILYQHDWIFLQAKKQHHVLKPDNYHWDFELILPGTLPETVQGCQYGSIKYTLKAVAERHSFAAANLHTQRKIALLRSLLPSSLEYLESAVISSTNSKIEYNFSADSTAYSLGDKISIMMNLRSANDLRVLNFSCTFREYITYTIRTNQRTDSRTISAVDKQIYSQRIDSWSHLIEIPIPNKPAYCLYDSQNNMIRIRHLLKLNFIIGSFDPNCLYELKATLPIIITSVSPNSESMNLPAYNENFLDKVFFEDDSLTLSRQYSTSPSSSSLHGIEELSRLPSYRSIASLIPAPLADSLLPPIYDASISGH